MAAMLIVNVRAMIMIVIVAFFFALAVIVSMGIESMPIAIDRLLHRHGDHLAEGAAVDSKRIEWDLGVRESL